MSTNIRKVSSSQSDGTIGHCEAIAIHSATVTVWDFRGEYRTDHLRSKWTYNKCNSTSEESVSF